MAASLLVISAAGSPRYFELILQYLRSNVLEIPTGFSPKILQIEAEFYGIQKIVDHLEHERKKKEEVKEQGLYCIGHYSLIVGHFAISLSHQV